MVYAPIIDSEVIDVQNLDLAQVSFGKPTKNAYGGHTAVVRYNGAHLRVKMDKLWRAPFRPDTRQFDKSPPKTYLTLFEPFDAETNYPLYQFLEKLATNAAEVVKDKVLSEQKAGFRKHSGPDMKPFADQREFQGGQELAWRFDLTKNDVTGEFNVDTFAVRKDSNGEDVVMKVPLTEIKFGQGATCQVILHVHSWYYDSRSNVLMIRTYLNCVKFVTENDTVIPTTVFATDPFK